MILRRENTRNIWTAAVEGPSENFARDFSGEPYGVLPKWLTENGVELPRKPCGPSPDEGELVKQPQDNAPIDVLPSSLERSTAAVSEPRVDAPEAAIAEPGPKNDAPTLAGTSTSEGKSLTAERTPV